MIGSIHAAMLRILAGEDLSADEMTAAVGAIMDGDAGEIEIAALLTLA